MNPEGSELEVREPTHACYVVTFHCARLPYIISLGAVARAESRSIQRQTDHTLP
jgi:hypothetical protein